MKATLSVVPLIPLKSSVKRLQSQAIFCIPTEPISDSVIASKTPVGIVAYVNGSTGFAVALTESSQTWGGVGYNVSCLGDLDEDETSADMGGASNTRCLVNDSQTHPAANYCNTFSAVSSGKAPTTGICRRRVS